MSAQHVEDFPLVILGSLSRQVPTCPVINPYARASYHGKTEEMCTQLWEGNSRKAVFLYSTVVTTVVSAGRYEVE